MKKLIAFFADNGVFSNCLLFGVIFAGAIALISTKREAFPNINFDIISISTIFPGSSPEEVERLISNPIERDLKEVDGIKELRSGSIEGRSMVIVELDPDTGDLDEAKTDIRDVVDKFNPPDGSEDPVVSTMSTKQSPVIELSIAAEKPELEMREFSKSLKRELEEIKGVARISERGVRDVEIRVEARPKKLARYSLALEDIIAALKGRNVNIPGGSLEGAKEKIVRTLGEYRNIKQIKETVIRANDYGRAITIGDVAKVFYTLEKATLLNRGNGVNSLSLTVLKKESADIIKVVDAVKKKVEDLKIDPNYSIRFINDNSYYVRRRINILMNNLGIGLILVMIVLSLFLPGRVAALVAIGIPFAFLGTIMLFYYGGVSLNLLTLMGLIIVTGMLVDDAIVVTDNAVRLIEEGEDPHVAAVKGTQQIWPAVTASVMTTIIVFVPMLNMSGIFGKFVKFIPLAVITTLFMSLVECFFILPHHVAYWFGDKNSPAKKQNFFRRLKRKIENFWQNTVLPKYEKILRSILRFRYLVIGATALLFVLSGMLAAFHMKKVLFPPDSIEIFMIRAEAPIGTSLKSMSKIMQPIEAVIKKLPTEELKDFVSIIGLQQNDPNDPGTKRGSHYAQIAVYLTPEPNRLRKANQIIDALREDIPTPETLKRLNFKRLNPGPPVGAAVSVGVQGSDYDVILPAVREIQKRLTKIKGTRDITDSYQEGKEEFHITLKQSEMVAAGLTTAQVGRSVRAAFEGIVATSIQDLDDEIDIRVSLPQDSRSDQSTLKKIRIPNSRGNLISLSRISNIELTRGITQYEHTNGRREVRVLADVDTEQNSSGEANNELRKLLEKDFYKLHPKIKLSFGGEEKDTQESMQSLVKTFTLALMGIFLILVLLFKNIFQPMLIILTIPLGVISVIWTFFIHGQPISFMGMLGTVALAGVIVNNAIVFIDFVNQGRTQNGLDRWDSIYVAGKKRIRPIFLTTLTTALGLLPTAYGIGGLDKFVVPIALSLGWGLAFGSLLSTLVFPAAISIMDDVQGLLSRKKH